MQKLRRRWFEIRWVSKRYVRIQINTVRRFFVNWLLGRDLTVLKYKTPQGYQVELIDDKRRITYGKWNVSDVSEREVKLDR